MVKLYRTNHHSANLGYLAVYLCKNLGELINTLEER